MEYAAMRKELKSADELSTLMSAAARKIESCSFLSDKSIFIHESSEPHTNWGYGTNTKIPDDCRRELDQILGELRLRYEMKK